MYGSNRILSLHQQPGTRERSMYGGLLAAQLESHGGCDLIPGLPGAHDLEHLEGAHAPRNAIERARGAGVRVGASQNLAGQGDAILQDHLMADSAATDIIELLDAKLFDELARDRLPLGVGNRERRNRMVEDDDDFAGVRNPLRHGCGRGQTSSRSERSYRHRRRRYRRTAPGHGRCAARESSQPSSCPYPTSCGERSGSY